MSSNFLDKSGLSHFWQKIKEMLQGKQDKLTAGNGITIDENNVISASGGGGGGSGEELYMYVIPEQTIKTGGYVATIKRNGNTFDIADSNAWSLQIQRQNILVPSLIKGHVTVSLACDIVIGSTRNYGYIVCELSSFSRTTGKLIGDILLDNPLASDASAVSITFYTKNSVINAELTAYEHRVI